MSAGTVYIIRGLELIAAGQELPAAALAQLEPQVVADLRERYRQAQVSLEAQAQEALATRNVSLFLLCVSSRLALQFFILNAGLLRSLGLYEAGLLDAYTTHPASNRQIPARWLRQLFTMADRATLRAAGEPFPGPGPYTLYRGVAGGPKDRRVRGLSWTLDQEKAWWFARRWSFLADPAVYRLTVP